MILNEGIVKICRLSNFAAAGDAPDMRLTTIARFWFKERTIGYGRQYAAKGVNEQVDMLLRIHYTQVIMIGMYAVLGNGDQFRITNVTPITDDESGLRATEITLMRLEEFYELQPAA